MFARRAWVLALVALAFAAVANACAGPVHNHAVEDHRQRRAGEDAPCDCAACAVDI